jgi:hypothetical protein
MRLLQTAPERRLPPHRGSSTPPYLLATAKCVARQSLFDVGVVGLLACSTPVNFSGSRSIYTISGGVATQ